MLVHVCGARVFSFSLSSRPARSERLSPPMISLQGALSASSAVRVPFPPNFGGGRDITCNHSNTTKEFPSFPYLNPGVLTELQLPRRNVFLNEFEWMIVEFSMLNGSCRDNLPPFMKPDLMVLLLKREIRFSRKKNVLRFSGSDELCSDRHT